MDGLRNDPVSDYSYKTAYCGHVIIGGSKMKRMTQTNLYSWLNHWSLTKENCLKVSLTSEGIKVVLPYYTIFVARRSSLATLYCTYGSYRLRGITLYRLYSSIQRALAGKTDFLVELKKSV